VAVADDSDGIQISLRRVDVDGIAGIIFDREVLRLTDVRIDAVGLRNRNAAKLI